MVDMINFGYLGSATVLIAFNNEKMGIEVQARVDIPRGNQILMPY